MYTFGKKSLDQLYTCRKELQFVANEAIKLVDFSIIDGQRDQKKQDSLYDKGFSKLKFPYSKHNSDPSDAFDFMPYPVNWHDFKKFAYIAGIMIGVGLSNGIVLRWGGDWKQDGKLENNSFDDLGHIEFLRNIET